MTTAIAFSRQNDAGSRAHTTECWENLFLVVVFVLERFNKWQEFNNETTRQLKN